MAHAPRSVPLKPLEGVRVLDLSRMIAGGVAGMLLADFGADVVKVEQPGSGDPLRQWTAGGEPLWWKVYARNKRYITLNLKSPRRARRCCCGCCRDSTSCSSRSCPARSSGMGLGLGCAAARGTRA